MWFNIIVGVFSLLIFLIGLLWWYQHYSRFFKLINQIPGPPAQPLLGHFFKDYAGITLEKLFLDDRERCTKYYPIFKQHILHYASVNILHPEDIELVLSNSKHNKKGLLYNILHMWLGTGLLTSNGEKWRTRRKMLTPAFHFSILQNFIDVFNEETASLIEKIQEQGDQSPVNIVPLITEFTLKSMAQSSMGADLNFDQEVNRNYKDFIFDYGKVINYRMIRPWLYQDTPFSFHPMSFFARKVVRNLHAFTSNVIQDRKRTRSSTDRSQSSGKRLAMLDLLLTAKDQGADIDDDGIREEVDTFMFEGHDTTAAAICFILLTLTQHQKVQEEIRQEIIDVLGDSDQQPTYNDLQQLSFTERCIKECLRLYPSVPFIARDPGEDIHTFTGYTIPKGAMINIHIYDIHRNPEIYPDPDKFDPDRFLPENIQKRHPYAYIPFSAGPRNCIGQRFAMLELKAVLCGILRKYVMVKVDDLKDYTFYVQLVLRTTGHSIKIKFVPRK